MFNANQPRCRRMRQWPNRTLKVLAIFILFSLTIMPLGNLQACMGTPAPTCGRSVFLAKFTPGVIVFPAAGAAINVPIGVLPFAIWNTNPLCSQPVGATLTLTLTCFPSGNVIGPQAFPVAVPVVPGPQPGGLINFVIPAGTFPAGSPPQICLVVGTYTVTFSDGTVLAFNGDTEVCIVPPSPLDASIPQLNMEYIPTSGANYQSCRRGDQANSYFLIENNDPTQAVKLDLSSIGRQVAQLPLGFSPDNAYANDVFSISLPEPNTDTYPAAFVEDLAPGELLKEPDPSVPNQQALSKSFTLQPCEAIIIGIAMRSYGMCANGSCNERLVIVQGQFDNGDPAMACASTLLVVDEAPPKSALCEINDEVKAGEGSEATWGPGHYADADGEIPHAETFSPGNLESAPGFLTSGDPDSGSFPAKGASYTRINAEVMAMNYNVTYKSAQCKSGINKVQIIGINNPDFKTIAVPVITFFGGVEVLQIILNPGEHQMQIFAQGELIYQGSIEAFFADPPPQFCIDKETCRTVTKSGGLSDKTLFVEAPAVSKLFENPDIDPNCDELIVYDNNGNAAQWDGTVTGSGITLPSASGTGSLKLCYDNLASLPVVPATTISYLDVSCPGGLAGRRVPVAIRIKVDANGNVLLPAPELDKRFVLQTAVPNPFTTETRINYSLTEGTPLDLQIFNTLGQPVRHLVSNRMSPAGDHYVNWDGTDDAGNQLNQGLYFCKMKAGKIIKTSSMLLIR